MTGSMLQHSRVVHIGNRAGMHARPAAQFVKCAKQYASEIFVRKAETEVNGKSIMGLMMLAAEFGSEIEIRAKGDDCATAVESLADLVESGFGEP
jgi:phosphocarrier protein